MLSKNPKKKRLIFISLWSPFCVRWKAASQTVVWSEPCGSQRDDALSLTGSLSPTYREWEECKLMSKKKLLSARVWHRFPSTSAVCQTVLPPTAVEWAAEHGRTTRIECSGVCVVYFTSTLCSYCGPALRNCSGFTLSTQSPINTRLLCQNKRYIKPTVGVSKVDHV